MGVLSRLLGGSSDHQQEPPPSNFCEGRAFKQLWAAFADFVADHGFTGMPCASPSSQQVCCICDLPLTA
jgi:hypothetical protein